MKFLLSLALIVVLASAHRGGYDHMFRPVRSCEQKEHDETQVAERTQEMLNKLQDVVSKVCSKDESGEVEATVKALDVEFEGEDVEGEVVEGEVAEEAQEKDMEKGNKRGKDGRRGHLEKIMEFVNAEDRCSQEPATVAEDLLKMLQQEKQDKNPCTTSVTFKDFQTRVSERCDKQENVEVVEGEDKEVDVDAGEEKDEVVQDGEGEQDEVNKDEEVVAETLARKDRMEKGEGKDKSDSGSGLCELSEEDLAVELSTTWTKFFDDTEEKDATEVSGVQFDLGLRKMRVMNDLKMAEANNCVVEPAQLLRRVLRKGGRHRGHKEEKPERDGENSEGSLERWGEKTEGNHSERWGEKPEGRHSERWGEKTEGNHSERWGEKTEGRHSERWGEKTEGRHSERWGEKTEGRHSERWGEKPEGRRPERDGEKPERDGEKPEMELSAAMQLVADFKTDCTPVNHDTVNDLFDRVQSVMAEEKANREAEKDGEGDVEKDVESEVDVEKDGEVDVEKDGEVDVEKDGESDVEKDGESDVEKDGESDVERDGESDVEKDGESDVEKEGEQEADVSVLNESDSDAAKEEDKVVDSVTSWREQMMRHWEEMMKARKEAAEKRGETEGESQDKPERRHSSRGRGEGRGNSRRPNNRFRWGRRKL